MSYSSFAFFFSRNLHAKLLVQHLLCHFFQPVLRQFLQLLQLKPFHYLVSKVVESCQPERTCKICQFDRKHVFFVSLLIVDATELTFRLRLCCFFAFGVVASTIAPFALEFYESYPNLEFWCYWFHALKISNLIF